MELNYVVDITSAYNDVLMIYGDHYQVQRYTHGIDRISMDFWVLDDHDNDWIPNGSEMNLSGERQRLYYLHDELGSVTKVIGENGKASAHYNYDEFGKPSPTVKFDQNWPGPDNTFGYTGYQYDVSAELWYAQARYYMPEIGRFISEDPWAGTIVTPNTMNPYPYVLNNPLKYIDPLGLMSEEGVGSSRAENNVGAQNKQKQSSNPINNTKKQIQEKGTKNGSETFYRDLDNKSNTNTYVAGSVVAADIPNWSTEMPKGLIGVISKFGKVFTGAAVFGYVIKENTLYTMTSEEEEALLRESRARQNKQSAERVSNSDVFPKNPDDFNPEGLEREEYDGGNVIKWFPPGSKKAKWEWNREHNPGEGDHYHKTPDGKKENHIQIQEIHIYIQETAYLCTNKKLKGVLTW